MDVGEGTKPWFVIFGNLETFSVKIVLFVCVFILIYKKTTICSFASTSPKKKKKRQTTKIPPPTPPPLVYFRLLLHIPKSSDATVLADNVEDKNGGNERERTNQNNNGINANAW